MKIKLSDAKKIGEHFNINTDIIKPKILKKGLEVELEHGTKLGYMTNITNDDLTKTMQIVLAHLEEYPNYYQKLEQMEKKLNKYWSNKEKPNIFN